MLKRLVVGLADRASSSGPGLWTSITHGVARGSQSSAGSDSRLAQAKDAVEQRPGHGPERQGASRARFGGLGGRHGHPERLSVGVQLQDQDGRASVAVGQVRGRTRSICAALGSDWQ